MFKKILVRVLVPIIVLAIQLSIADKNPKIINRYENNYYGDVHQLVNEGG